VFVVITCTFIVSVSLIDCIRELFVVTGWNKASEISRRMSIQYWRHYVRRKITSGWEDSGRPDECVVVGLKSRFVSVSGTTWDLASMQWHLKSTFRHGKRRWENGVKSTRKDFMLIYLESDGLLEQGR
jgi:hypothetical protein